MCSGYILGHMSIMYAAVANAMIYVHKNITMQRGCLYQTYVDRRSEYYLEQQSVSMDVC